MLIEIGKNVRQTEGYLAFIPNAFPPKGMLDLPFDLLIKAAEAGHLVGKLDGITHTLPDVDFFLSMFVTKDATSSAQIEGTKATMVDALEKDAGIAAAHTDADDILFYIKALHYGTDRLKNFPFSLRFIRELHAQLMTGARSTHFADPGEFRKSQNYIGGTMPSNASFVPPTVNEMHRSLDDFEKFLHNERSAPPLIHAGFMHAQFETIHPFLDGNGRTGRLLISTLLYQRNLLERPVLFFSSYFKRHQKAYYQALQDYHSGNPWAWLAFFLDAVIDTANDSIRICKEITKLREEDMTKIQALAKRESESGVAVMRKLYAQPIITTRIIMEWTQFTRAGAQKLIDRFINLNILEPKDERETYDRSYMYRTYLNIFYEQ